MMQSLYLWGEMVATGLERGGSDQSRDGHQGLNSLRDLGGFWDVLQYVENLGLVANKFCGWFGDEEGCKTCEGVREQLVVLAERQLL